MFLPALLSILLSSSILWNLIHHVNKDLVHRRRSKWQNFERSKLHSYFQH